MTNTMFPLVHDTTAWHVDIRELSVPMPSPDRWSVAVRELSARPIEMDPEPAPAISREVAQLLERVAQGLSPA